MAVADNQWQPQQLHDFFAEPHVFEGDFSAPQTEVKIISIETLNIAA